MSRLRAAFHPRSVAIVGASDNPHKVGGRPILYMKRYGYRGAIYPVNPGRAEVQGLKAYSRLEDVPETPDLVVIAVAGAEAERAVAACARRGVNVAVVMTSGFGELGAEGRAAQDRMAAQARAAGMSLIGPNCQGLANFATGVVANFSTVFHELEGKDGPLAIVSQSGATSQAIYSLAREKGVGVRHVHASGNEADVTVADLALEIVEDPDVRLLLLYMEAIHDPKTLAQAAEKARARDLPMVAVKAGRTESGKRAASSHTGALATEDRVIDAFFAKHGIWRVPDPHGLVSAAELYLAGVRPKGKRIVVLSNSGASCVMAADAAEEMGLLLPGFSPDLQGNLKKTLPPFATPANPLDVTGAVLTDSGLFGAVLPVIGEAGAGDMALLAVPVAGTGYDVPRFARDLAAFRDRFAQPVALAAPQAEVRAEFARLGIPAFAREREALQSLAQLALHSELLRKEVVATKGLPPPAVPEGQGFLDEAQSLALLAAAGIPVVGHRLCRTEAEARAAFCELGGPVAVKGCSRDVPHKTEAGLVKLGASDPDAVAAGFRSMKREIERRKADFAGVIVAKMTKGRRELALGARFDPLFGPIVMVGDGGIYLEALKDFRLLLPPFGEAEVLEALRQLRIAPLLAGLRGEPPLDSGAFARMAVALGDAMLGWGGKVASVDLNPVMVFETGRGAVAADALVERAAL
jgi:acyl-CoA synthetase (NDP forming)